MAIDDHTQTNARTHDADGNPITSTGTRLDTSSDVVSSALPTGAATEATLSAAEVTLDRIADTDGIKKITDELPSGTQEIGSVAQGTAASAGTPWWSRLTDGIAAIGSIVDNSIRRLEARATLSGQVQGAGAEVKVTVIEDTEESTEQRLQTEARIAPGSVVGIGTGIPSNPAALVIEFLTNGGSEDMLVDGSSTPVAFEYQPGTGVTLAVQQLLVVFTADDFEFDGASFGPNSALTNGIKFETDVGGVVTEVFSISQNEDYLRVPGRIPLVNNTGPKDVLSAAFDFGGLLKLDEAADDKLIVTVQDDLTSVKFKYLTCTVYGAIE